MHSRPSSIEKHNYWDGSCLSTLYLFWIGPVSELAVTVDTAVDLKVIKLIHTTACDLRAALIHSRHLIITNIKIKMCYIYMLYSGDRRHGHCADSCRIPNTRSNHRHDHRANDRPMYSLPVAVAWNQTCLIPCNCWHDDYVMYSVLTIHTDIHIVYSVRASATVAVGLMYSPHYIHCYAVAVHNFRTILLIWSYQLQATLRSDCLLKLILRPYLLFSTHFTIVFYLKSHIH